MQQRLLYAQLITVVVLAALHFFILEHSLYWRFVWLDTVSHTLGGLWASLFVFWLFLMTGRRPAFLWGVVGALFLGISWELFEVAIGIPRAANYSFDTSVDIFMDMVGGVIGALAAQYLMKSPVTPGQG